MKRGELEAFIAKYYKDGTTKDGGKIIVGHFRTRKPEDINVKEIISEICQRVEVTDKNAQQIFLLCAQNNSKICNDDCYFENLLKAKGLKDGYIIAVEPKVIERATTWSFGDGIDRLLEKAKLDKEKIGIYRVFCEGREEKTSFYAVLIKVKESGNEETKYLDAYFAASDSRTYGGLKYTVTQFQTATSVNIARFEADWPKNLLIFGAPGTGKSYSIDKKIKELKWENNMKRVTFYEDYSYEKFVGSYIPKVNKDKTTSYTGKFNNTNLDINAKTESVTYEFVPGIFLKMVADAYYETTITNGVANPFVLVIEEINRANAAAVFGEMFQLLDRKSDGESEYEIALESTTKEWLVKYLLSKGNYEGEDKDNAIRWYEEYADHFKLPQNFYLWATMNSADQGVFPLDSAFKRRWSFLYKSVTESRVDNNRYIYAYWKKSQDNEAKPYFIDWDAFRNAINKVMGKPQYNIEEDRFIGPWYFKALEYSQIFEYTKSPKESRLSLSNPICDKLLNYIRQDVFRNSPDDVFENKYLALYQVRQGMQNGVGINEMLKIEIEDEALIDINDVQICFEESCDQSYKWSELIEISKNGWEIDPNIILDINNILTLKNREDSSKVREKLAESTINQIKMILGDDKKTRLEEWLKNMPKKSVSVSAE